MTHNELLTARITRDVSAVLTRNGVTGGFFIAVVPTQDPKTGTIVPAVVGRILTPPAATVEVIEFLRALRVETVKYLDDEIARAQKRK